MQFWSNLNISYEGSIISTGVIILVIIIFFVNKFLKPKFVIPNSKINILNKFIKKLLIFLIICCLILIPLNISFIKSKKIVKTKTLSIQILFDVSLSMTADDIKPSRFESAKHSVINLVNNLNGYNISIITFSGIPFVWSPFSDDTNAIISKLNTMKLSNFPPTMEFVGTAIGDAILLGIENLIETSQYNKKPGIIILLTDGDSNRGKNPIQASNLAKKQNIPIYTLGIGKKEYIVGKDYNGFPVTTKINIPLLKQISENSNGKFYRVLSDQDFSEIFNEIEKYVKSEEKEKIIYEYFYLNNILKYILLFCLINLLIIRIYILINFNKSINKK